MPKSLESTQHGRTGTQGRVEQPLSDEAVAQTRGIVATWRGRPIHAYYTSTCGGHTEDGEHIGVFRVVCRDQVVAIAKQIANTGRVVLVHLATEGDNVIFFFVHLLSRLGLDSLFHFTDLTAGDDELQFAGEAGDTVAGAGLPPDVVAKEWLLDGDRSLLNEEAGLRRARAGTLLSLERGVRQVSPSTLVLAPSSSRGTSGSWRMAKDF